MQGTYPPRLSVAELRQELDAYLGYRQTGGADRKVDASTISADKTHIRQFLGWLETGRAGQPDYGELAREYPL
jgi:hypothetical protein